MQVSLANNRYELVSPLGQGGMACVFKAFDTRLKVEKAIKIPNHFCLTNPKIRSRFETEAETMAQLHHKNIVIVHDIRDEMYKSPNQMVAINLIYMVMEMMPGGSLKDRMDKYGLHPQQAIDAAIAMASGLGFAHANNVVHRDVKLDNVLISADNTLKVTDFGIAQIDGGSGMTQTGATMGTLAYMAPEQKLSSRRANALSDLYAVGASFYVMLTAENPSELYAEDIQEKAFANLDSKVADFFRKACHIEPKQRFQNSEEMIAALEALRNSYGPLPADSLPFYVPKDADVPTPDDMQKQSKKVVTMWTTLLGLEPGDLGDVFTSPERNDTALDIDLMSDSGGTAYDLGLDLSSDPELVGGSVADVAPPSIPPHISTMKHNAPSVQQAPSTAGQAQQQTPYVEPTLPTPAASPSKSSMPLIAGGLLALGGALFFFMGSTPESQNTVPAVTTEQTKALENNNTQPIAVPAENASAQNTSSAQTTNATNTPPQNTGAAKPAENKAEKVEKVEKVEKAEKVPEVAKQEKKIEPTKPVEKTIEKAPSIEKTVEKPAETKPVEPVVEKSGTASATGKTGIITINATPWAQILIDGGSPTCNNKSNKNTPCTVTLPVGKHSVTLIKQGKEDEKTTSMTIKEGENAAFCWNFMSNSAC